MPSARKPATTSARELWDWIQSKGGEAEPFQFSLAELQRSLRIFKNDREGAIKAIRLIEARDLIRLFHLTARQPLLIYHIKMLK